jgi:hypothetical protein
LKLTGVNLKDHSDGLLPPVDGPEAIASE